MPSITTSPARSDGVSVVLPVRNGEPWLAPVIDAILAQDPGGGFEVIVIEDGSADGSADVIAGYAVDSRVRVVDGPRRGAAAAINLGLSLARYREIAQIDQDVVVAPGWLATLRAALAPPEIGAAQGYYATDRRAPLIARVMGLDLEQRYDGIEGSATDHVCTGNALYKAAAVEAAGGLDESLGYGYDNDLSYRVRAAGYGLVLCRDARSHHHWRESLGGYLAQQFGLGYGRLEVVARHPHRLTGDAVSPALMMAHPIGLAMAAGAAITGTVSGRHSWWMLAAILAAVLVSERAVAGVRAWRRFGDPAALAFPVVHLLRDAAWVAAIVTWSGRRVLRRPGRPVHSVRRTRGPSGETV
jgi:GT2 family glycosyltransferase